MTTTRSSSNDGRYISQQRLSQFVYSVLPPFVTEKYEKKLLEMIYAASKLTGLHMSYTYTESVKDRNRYEVQGTTLTSIWTKFTTYVITLYILKRQ